MYICPYSFMVRAPKNIYKIVVDTNMRKMSLFKNGKLFKTYKVAVGKPSTPSPKGTFKIVNRAINPKGPFGVRWLGLSAPGGDYGIHGTNNPASIGKAVSNGCIRMYNKDVLELDSLVSIGTEISIYRF